MSWFSYTLLCCFAHLLDLMNVNLIANARITLSTQYTSHNEPLFYSISLSLAAGQPQPFVSAIPPLFRRGETPLYIPSIPDVDRYPSSEIHLPRKPSDMFDPSARYRLKTRSHSARMTRFDCKMQYIFPSFIMFSHVCLFKDFPALQDWQTDKNSFLLARLTEKNQSSKVLSLIRVKFIG